MLSDINLQTLEATQICGKCEAINTIQLEKRHIEFMEDLGGYENYNLPVCKCGVVEILNMNIPENEFEYSDLIPLEDWQFRSFLRAFAKYCKGETTTIDVYVPPKKPLKQGI